MSELTTGSGITLCYMSKYTLWKTYLSVLPASAILFIVPFEYAQAQITIVNPLRVSDFNNLVLAVAQAVVTIALPFAALAIMFIGFRLVVAAHSGNESQLKQAKTMLMYVIIGTVIIVGALAIAIAVVNTVKNITN